MLAFKLKKFSFKGQDSVSGKVLDESSQSYYKKALEIFIHFKDKHAIEHVFRNAKILAEESGDEGVLKEMVEILLAHFSEEEVMEFLYSPPDS
ncbi:MAG: hypothetical protein JSV88_23740 [Candidatus Aminicenantes bacterium]|nr:MAG: hypothetical protein JSV88_23740 [Candidatus Aminicenantes bacterium]